MRWLLPFNLSWFCLTTTVASAEEGDPYFGPHSITREDVAENIVSVASGYSQPIRTAPAVTTVITAQQIKDIGARDLWDVLKTVPGFFLGENTIQIEPIISVRGFKSSFNQTILFLLDGIPQTNPVTGDRAAVLGIVPLDIIERVEIMRGPGSALYGADAYSAVVNIITRRAPPQKSQATVGIGSQQMRDARWFGGGRTGHFKIVGALEYRETDGNAPLIAADSQTMLDGLLGTQASRAPSEANTHLRLFGAQLNVTSENIAFMLRTSLGRDLGMNVGLANALDPFGRVDITTLEGRLTWTTHRDDWAAKIVLDELYYQSVLNNAHYFPPGAFGIFPEGVIASSDTQQYETRLQGSAEYTGWPAHHLSVGLGAVTGKTRQNSESRNYTSIDGALIPLANTQTIHDPNLLMFGGREFSHDLQFVFLQDEWTLAPNWMLTLGIRYDHYSDFGDQFNPRIALVWDTSPYLTTKLIYGKGFRGPSLIDTSSRQAPAFIGNPDLDPERIESFELAFDYQFRPNLMTRLNLFHQETEDQIHIVPVGNLTSTPLNVANQVGRGVELEARWDIDRHTQLYGAYSYQVSTDETTDTDVGYSPHHILYARWQHRQTPWFFSIQAWYVGQRDRGIMESSFPAKTYTLVDGLVRYEFTSGFELGFQVRNLFNADAEDAVPGSALPVDIPLPGRTYYFTVTSRF